MSNSDSKLAISRRMILRGAGGFALTLPFLSSLAPRSVSAAPTGARPRLFWLGTDHGGAFDSNMFPADALLTNRVAAVPGHTVASGRLAATVSGGSASLSPILRASQASLTPRMVGKMNVIRGLDVPFYIAHNTGLHLGNFARNDNNGNDGAAVSGMGMRPTIDQLMASSPSFYTPGDLTGTKLRAMTINPDRQLSWAFANPQQGAASAVTSVQGARSSLQLFNTIFGGSTSTRARPPVADKVLQSYKSLRESNTRLSAADRARLDTHIAMIAQLQSSLNARLSCSTPPTPTSDAQSHQGPSRADAILFGQLWADVIAASFACNASRIAVLGWGDTSAFSGYLGNNWHQDVAHQWFSAQPQQWLTQSYQGVFENVFLYLAQKLDQLDDGNGASVLDNTLMVWSQESGMASHDSYSIPVVTFGGAAGYFNTGMYVDYRKVGAGTPVTNNVEGYQSYMGLLYNQWLANVLLGMGVPRGEFELWRNAQGQTTRGYGTPYLTTEGWTPPYRQHYGSLSSQYFNIASDPLPFLVAT